ncbi:MAG: LysR family transcriptional regulator [Gemmiger sp.]|uniref:LysR family transcriptional regulator n=1 Tax=Gemmiger sp. TaxID=2049027 RepID=UPI002E790A01|nr:LysR family transcriptional regulator [Gemmiger sp.]MEE0800777.1 LysR family transcriptional regulator [Gemmiger sp.]
MNVNYEYYRIFYYVCKYHSFTKAANVLCSNQPNITRAMNRLEEQLGCKLLVRSNQGITLTPEGKTLYFHVEIAQNQLQAAEDELAGNAGLQNGTITVGASETALNVFLLDKLQMFRQRYPDIRMRIVSHSTPQAIAALSRGLVDLIVISTPSKIEKAMRETMLASFQEVLIAGPNLRDLADKPHHLAELQQYPLICLGPDTMTYAFYNQLYLKHGLVLQPDTEPASADQILPLVKSGLGLGFVPLDFVRDALSRQEVFEVPLYETISLRQISLVRDKRRAPSVAAHAFEQMLLEGVRMD